MSDKKYHYFYKITNNINGRFYYGVHNTSNLNDGYMGSGVRINRAYKKYGIENFTKEILKFFDTTKEAFDYEAEVVTESLVANKECYNSTTGGKRPVFMKGYAIVKDETGKTFSCSKNDPNYLSGKYTGATKGFVPVKDKDGNCFSVNKNDPRYLSGELKHTCTGLVHVKDKNGNIYTVETNDPRYLSGELIPLYTGTKWTNENKEKLKKIFAEKEHQKGEKNSQFGTKWMYKNNITKKVKKEEIEKYLNEGWLFGNLINRKQNQ